MSADDITNYCMRHAEQGSNVRLHGSGILHGQGTPDLSRHVVAHQVQCCPTELGRHK